MRTNGAYVDALIGKWHLSRRAQPDAPLAFGMDNYFGFLSGGVDDYYGWAKVEDGVASTSTDYVTAALTDASLNWVGEQSQPWLLWLAHATPHTPYHVPPAGTFSINTTGNNVRQYVAMIENLDYETGRLLSGLSEEVRNNTLVIFVGDNGTPGNVMQDYPDGHGKGSLYQGGVRVPLIVAGAGVTRAGEREPALVHITDLHATILEAAGATLPGGVRNSLSFHPLLTGTAMDTRTYNYNEVLNANNPTRSGWTIRNQRYKLIEFADGLQEFYDLELDSFETSNLLASPLTDEQSSTKEDLEAEAAVIRSDWSCRDHIQNGVETGIDCGTDACGNCTTSVYGADEIVDLQLFPNPTSGLLTLSSAETLLEEIRVFDVSGKLLQQLSGLSIFSHQIDLGSFRNRVLLVEVRSSRGVSVRQVVVD